MRLMLFLCIAAWAQPAVDIHHVTGRASDRLTTAQRWWRTAQQAAWRDVKTPEERDVVGAIMEVYRGIFRPELSSAPKVVTLTENGQDILVARWTGQYSQGRVSELIVWDAPNQTSFIFRLQRGSWSSDAEIRLTFEQLLLPPAADGRTPPATSITANVAVDFLTGRLIGAGWFSMSYVPRQFDTGPSDWFDLWGSDDSSYLAAGFARFAAKGYSWDMSIPERFPPLEARVGNWPTQRILDELSHGGFAADSRDRILGRELMRREVAGEELLEVLRRRQPDVSGALLFVIVGEHQVAHFAGVIREYLRDDRGCGLCNEAFDIVGKSDEVNFTDVALEVLRRGHVSLAPFAYVSDHGTTAADYDALAELRPSYPFGHEYLLERMRRRLGLPQKDVLVK
jgi:hypothetical protein